jgi:starch synthase
VPKKISPSSKPLQILFVAAEVAPFATVGGLSQVIYYLSSALARLGHQVRVFMPLYGTIDAEKYKFKTDLQGLQVPTGDPKKPFLICNVKTLKLKAKGPQFYFLENQEYFEQRANVYNYEDDHIRFALLSRGALEWLTQSRWYPDLLHAHDWHTGYAINYLRTLYADHPAFKKTATLYSLHNLYQGLFDFAHANDLQMDDGHSPLEPFFSERLRQQNSLRRGVIYADVVNTVSQTYSREIMQPEYGGNLAGLFQDVRSKLFGVLNGLDYQEFNPATDTIINSNYSVNKLAFRDPNKADLQKEFCLKVDPQVPILAVSGRLDVQKGLDLVVEVLPYLLKEEPIQFIALGGGDDHYLKEFSDLQKKFPRRVGTHLKPNFTLPRKIFAGADLLLMPSKYEPGGIVAIECQRYGAVPLVRATGGLDDSVEPFDSATGQGTGFSFREFHPYSFIGTIYKALFAYHQPQVWKTIVQNAMRADFSWRAVALKYLDLYKRAISWRKAALSPNPPRVYRIRY